MQTVEAGRMLWDKKRHWKAAIDFTELVPRQTLCLSAYYNYQDPNYYYALTTQGGAGWRDKDAFPTALRALIGPGTLSRHPVSPLVENHPVDVGVGITMIQYDPSSLQENETPRPLFLHYNIAKWGVRHFMCGTYPEDPVEQTRRTDSTHTGATFQGRHENPAEGLLSLYVAERWEVAGETSARGGGVGWRSESGV